MDETKDLSASPHTQGDGLDLVVRLRSLAHARESQARGNDARMLTAAADEIERLRGSSEAREAVESVVRCLRGDGAEEAGYSNVTADLRVEAIRDALSTRGFFPFDAEIGDHDPTPAPAPHDEKGQDR